jgi:hypothetical protein
MRGKTIVALAALIPAGGCMQYLVQPPRPSIAGDPNPVVAKSYLGSELQKPPYVLATACVGNEQIARVIVKRDFGQGLVSWLTLGLVAPATIVYECANVSAPPLGDTDQPTPSTDGGR